MGWLDKKLKGRFRDTDTFLKVRDYLENQSMDSFHRLMFEYLLEETERGEINNAKQASFADWLLTRAEEWEVEQKKKGGSE